MNFLSFFFIGLFFSISYSKLSDFLDDFSTIGVRGGGGVAVAPPFLPAISRLSPSCRILLEEYKGLYQGRRQPTRAVARAQGCFTKLGPQNIFYGHALPSPGELGKHPF